mmetsp:Transcript_118558/g.215387  ORF Transcript_118558/g.215387 Transcript_118558/m.215387 type:complete len:84 (+) Transcript_118558:941-1192(+)
MHPEMATRLQVPCYNHQRSGESGPGVPDHQSPKTSPVVNWCYYSSRKGHRSVMLPSLCAEQVSPWSSSTWLAPPVTEATNKKQ